MGRASLKRLIPRRALPRGVSRAVSSHPHKRPRDGCLRTVSRLAHKGRLALIRSLHLGMSSHNDGSIEFLTGKATVADPTTTAQSEHPDFGMIARPLRPESATDDRPRLLSPQWSSFDGLTVDVKNLKVMYPRLR